MKKVKGIYSNLVVPFQNTGDIDERLFVDILKYQVNNGINNFIVNVANAEYPTISKEEKRLLLQIVKDEKEQNEENISIVSTIVVNNLPETIEDIEAFQEIGCDFILLSIPKLEIKSKTGILSLMKEAVKFSSKDLIVDISNIFKLSDKDDFSIVKRIIDLTQVKAIQLKDPMDLIRILRYKNMVDKDFKILFQNELCSMQSLFYDIDAVSTDLASIIPKQLVSMYNLIKNKKTVDSGLKLCSSYYELFALFTENLSPMPVKSVLSSLNVIEDVFRIPLHSVTLEQKRGIKRLMELFDFKKLFKNFNQDFEEGYKEI